MPDSAAGTLAVPIWLAGAAAAVLVVAVLLAVKRAGGVALITSLFRVGLIAAIVLGAWLYVQERDVAAKDPNPGVERRSLDDRKAMLTAGAIAPGSALSCLDELAGEAVEAACEKAVFASPESVASAVKYVSAQLALLDDGSAYAARDASYASDLAPLRTAIELDRFGLVAHVLGDREGCSAESCDALSRLRDATRVLANLRDHTFDEQVKKYTAIGNAPHPADGVIAAVGPPVALPGAAAPGTVAPRYDFPSAKSIPPVSIMAPEPPPPRDPATDPASQSAAAAPASVTPVPPRRPPQVRSAPPPPRAAVPRPDLGDPADGALGRVPPPPSSIR
jgi:hypothetical protein